MTQIVDYSYFACRQHACFMQTAMQCFRTDFNRWKACQMFDVANENLFKIESGRHIESGDDTPFQRWGSLE